MIINGHAACQITSQFQRFFAATGANPGESNNKALAKSLLKHIWTFDDAMQDISMIYSDFFEPQGLRFHFFVCPLLVDAWECGNSEYARRQLKNQNARLLSWDEIGRLAEAGNVLGSHGTDHASFSEMSQEQQIEQFERSREMIKQRTGYNPTSFAFPFGKIAPSSVLASQFARAWYDEVYLSDNGLAVGEVADGVFNRRHGEFGSGVYRGLLIGSLNILFGIKKWQSS